MKKQNKISFDRYFISFNQPYNDCGDEEDGVTETTVMLEKDKDDEIVPEGTLPKDQSFIRSRSMEPVSRIEYWARGGLQESCGNINDV